MPLISTSLLVDLDDSGAFATEIGPYVYTDVGVSLQGYGREGELDAAGSYIGTFKLRNADGRFTPGNAASPYFPDFTGYKQARLKQTFNAVTYNQITGLLTVVSVRPGIDEQVAYVTLEDYMYLLSRTEIRRPLMLGQYTGVIVHRLLDDVEGAEGREACLNPAFAKDLTGWTTFGTATNLRMTASSATFEPIAEKILEGPGALYVLTSAVNSGARYTMTGKAGLKYTLVAYVKPESDGDIGASVQMRMADNVGTVATGTAGVLNRDYWVPIEVTGTYNGGSTSQFIDILVPVGGTRVRVGAVHAVPFVSRMARDIDDGQSRLEKYSYHRGPALEAVQEVRDNELGGLFLFDPAGTACFEDRHHRMKGDHLISQATFNTAPATLSQVEIDYSEHANDRIKSVRFTHPHYVDGVPGTVIKAIDRVIPLPIGIRWPVELDYQGGLAKDTIEPIANTDYVISASWDGTGVDMTGSVTFEFYDFGSASVGYFTNNAASIVYLRTYQVRGTPTKLAEDTGAATYTAPGGPALAATLSHDYHLNGSEPHVQAWCNHLGIRFSTQRGRLGITVKSPYPSPLVTTDIVTILGRQVSDRITFTNTGQNFSTKVNQDFYIDSIDKEIEGQSITATLRLTPVWDDFARTGVTVTNGAAKTGP